MQGYASALPHEEDGQTGKHNRTQKVRKAAEGLSNSRNRVGSDNLDGGRSLSTDLPI